MTLSQDTESSSSIMTQIGNLSNEELLTKVSDAAYYYWSYDTMDDMQKHVIFCEYYDRVFSVPYDLFIYKKPGDSDLEVRQVVRRRIVVPKKEQNRILSEVITGILYKRISPLTEGATIDPALLVRISYEVTESTGTVSWMFATLVGTTPDEFYSYFASSPETALSAYRRCLARSIRLLRNRRRLRGK